MREVPEYALPGLQGPVVDDVQAIRGLIVAQRCQGVAVATEARVYESALPLRHRAKPWASQAKEPGTLKPGPR